LILGSDEVKEQKVGVKDLRESGEQVTVLQSELSQYLETYLG
jgi:histidyl-tRNA synthetase